MKWKNGLVVSSSLSVSLSTKCCLKKINKKCKNNDLQATCGHQLAALVRHLLLCLLRLGVTFVKGSICRPEVRLEPAAVHFQFLQKRWRGETLQLCLCFGGGGVPKTPGVSHQNFLLIRFPMFLSQIRAVAAVKRFFPNILRCHLIYLWHTPASKGLTRARF